MPVPFCSSEIPCPSGLWVGEISLTCPSVRLGTSETWFCCPFLRKRCQGGSRRHYDESIPRFGRTGKRWQTHFFAPRDFSITEFSVFTGAHWCLCFPANGVCLKSTWWLLLTSRWTRIQVHWEHAWQRGGRQGAAPESHRVSLQELWDWSWSHRLGPNHSDPHHALHEPGWLRKSPRR